MWPKYAWDRQMVSGRIKINGLPAGLRQDSSISIGPLKADRPADINERETRARPSFNYFPYFSRILKYSIAFI